jgi:hypothetical protein
MNDLDLPPRRTLPPDARERLRDTALAAGPHRSRADRYRGPVAVAAGVAVIAAAAIGVLQPDGTDDPAGVGSAITSTQPPSADETLSLPPQAPDTFTQPPPALPPDTFFARCVNASQAPGVDPHKWEAGAVTRAGDLQLMMIRGPGDDYTSCHENTTPSGEPVTVASGGVRAPGASDPLPDNRPPQVPLLACEDVGTASGAPTDYTVLCTAPVTEDAAGMTMTLHNGDTITGAVKNGTAVAIVPFDSADRARDLLGAVVSVRLVDANGATLYEGPLTG